VFLAGVTLLQFMKKAPDRKAAERTVLNLGWKCALGLPPEYQGFHPTTLAAFRNRLVEHGMERLLFDAVVGEPRAQGRFGRAPSNGWAPLTSSAW
jgi:transposase